MERKIDLNCDMGESFGAYSIGCDEKVMPQITSANIACGWHAGDPKVMANTVKLAALNKVNVGAHPGYPDKMGFGRRSMQLTKEELRCAITYQIGALSAFCKAEGVSLSHVKPHGAMYHAAIEDEKIAHGLAEAVSQFSPEIYMITLAGAKGAKLRVILKKYGLRVLCEAFPDRAYSPSGNLVPRGEMNSLISTPEEISERALTIAKDRRVMATDGTMISIDADTICIHGDGIHALHSVTMIRKKLLAAGVTIAPF